ncbi:OX-2 membrane glycoprotein-like%2C partial [Xyrichtys novacula]|uniref:OX-2 membrane glycoprotein-like, partial n=1 Tax=Xyrichtys novacula TaxID=13765 RepID=A0AAV1HNY9_XYRNO|nr:OX-2 membrane glycoprotein-like%2C partial [Xyrichtys novacula]
MAEETSLYACILLLFALGIIQEGGAVLIQTQSEVTARLGDQVVLNCLLTQSWDVRQITWQKVSPGGERTVATYNKDFGQRVNASFSDKVEIRDCGLLNSSIVIRKLTQQDEGCYKCMFNTYPRGAFFGLTCITPYELYGPVLHIRGQNSTRDLVVSCSASGRPPPSMEITFPQQDLYLLKTSSDYVLNDSTVTVTVTAVLSRFHQYSVPVGCAAQVLSLPQTKPFRVFLEVEAKPAAERESEAGNISRSRTLVIVSAVLVVSVGLSVALFFLYKFKKQTSL